MGQVAGRALGNDGDPATPNFFDWLMLGPTAPDILQERAQNRTLFGARMGQVKREEADAEQERTLRQQREAMVEQYISSLPPERQAQARMAYAVDPESFAEAMAQQMGGGGWQVGQGYSHAFRTNPDGTVTLGDPLPLRPRAPIQGYVMPNDLNEWEYADE